MAARAAAPVPAKRAGPQKWDGLLEGFCPEPRAEERVALNSNGRLLLLLLADIDWLEAAGHRVALHLGQETHLLDESFASVAAKLPPGRFVRIRPSTLVKAELFAKLQSVRDASFRVPLRHGRH